MTPFEAYQLFHALRLHFAGKFDFVKYKGRMKFKSNPVHMRYDANLWAKLAKHADPQGLIVANMIAKKDMWITEMLSVTGRATYVIWKKHTEALTYFIKQDIDKLNPNFDANFEATPSEHPPLLLYYLRGMVSLELLVILDDLVGFAKIWNKKLKGDPTWDAIHLLIKRYRPFIKYDRSTMKELFVEKFDERH